MYKSPYHNIKKSDLWIRGIFVAIAVALVIAHE
jgi:hypothetical protein